MSRTATNLGSDDIASAKTGYINEQDKIIFGNKDQRDYKKLYEKQWGLLSQIPTPATVYPAYSYLFNNSKSTFIKEADIAHFDEVIECLKKACEPLIFEFVEDTKNLAFLKVKTKFFEYLFMNNVLWVWYDSEEEQFYLLIKSNPEDPKCTEYYDLIANKNVVLPAEEPIKVMWDGRENTHFNSWFRVCYKFVMREKMLDKLFFVMGKRIKFSHPEKINHNNLEEELINTNPYVNVLLDTTSADPLMLIDPGSLDSAVANHYVFWDRDLAELGRVANINDKEEKKTTGENYKDIHAVVCRQQGVLDQLTIFALELEKQKGLLLEFKVLGVIDKTKEDEATEANKEDGGDEGEEDE